VVKKLAKRSRRLCSSSLLAIDAVEGVGKEEQDGDAKPDHAWHRNSGWC